MIFNKVYCSIHVIYLWNIRGLKWKTWCLKCIYFPTVRLGGETYATHGLVQVYHNKAWGWICNQQWDDKDADVVCKGLGYENATFMYSNPVDKGGIVWMNYVQCNGSERSLVSCAHDGWQDHSCAKGQLAGVVCSIPQGQHQLLSQYSISI